MNMVKLKKAIKTVVKSFAKDAAGKNVKDEAGNEIVSAQRTIDITDVELPQYATLAEIVQAAGDEQKVVEYVNSSVLADGKSRVRNVGLSHEASDDDVVIITAGREVAAKFNPFADRRKGEGVTALANKMKDILAAQANGASDEDILALIRGGTI